MNTGHENGRFVIDPGAYRTNQTAIRFCVVWLSIWLFGTALIAPLTLNENSTFFYFWLTFAAFAALLVIFAIFSRKRKQILEVCGDSLVIQGAGMLSLSKTCVEKQDLKAFTLERRKAGRTRESIYTLNLVKKSGFLRNRIILANFVHPEDLAVLFEEIRGFLQKSGFVFDVKNTWVSEENAYR